MNALAIAESRLLAPTGLDTDALAARSISGMRCMILGAQRFDGHGTGGDAVKGRTAMQDDLETVTAALTGVRLAVVVTAPLTTNETWTDFKPGELMVFVDGVRRPG